MRRLALAASLLVAGCLDMTPLPTHGRPDVPPPPGGGAGGNGDGAFCGDGACEVQIGETPLTCPLDCTPPPPPPPPCNEVPLDQSLPLSYTGPVGQTYAWTAPSTGIYTIDATAAFATQVVIQRDSCHGEILSPGDLTLYTGNTLAITVSGPVGTTGAIQLTIDRQPDACGDAVCEASESDTTCVDDCPPPPVISCGDGSCNGDETDATCPADCPTFDPCDDNSCGGSSDEPTCGDGRCDAGEICGIDCDSTTTSPPPSYCGDGTCDGGEDTVSCSTDCGSGDDSGSDCNWWDDDPWCD